jgi:hypothetical protein
MNYQLPKGSVLLMSRRPGAPYDDQVDEKEKILIYEGHDCSKKSDIPDPKKIDQPEFGPNGRPTQNGLFAAAVKRYKENQIPPEKVRVFEKIRDGIWVYNGAFELLDCWTDTSTGRKVFKFKLRLSSSGDDVDANVCAPNREDDRIIPSWVKQEVWKRDQGKCQICGVKAALHFDHIIPYSKGGSSKDPKNIQILCGLHNLAKHDKIE